MALALLVADQLTKYLALHSLISEDGSYIEQRILGDFLTLRLAFNSGAAFSLATNKTLLLSLFSIFVGGFILMKSKSFTSSPWIIGSGLIVGGIAGNLCDRIIRAPHALMGEVVDWIHISHWPTFNLADTSIVLGAALIAALTLRNIPAKTDQFQM